MAITRQGNPLLPAIIIVLFLALLVFMFVSRKRETGPSHPQSATPNRQSTSALMTLLRTVSTLRRETVCQVILRPAFSSNVPARQGCSPVSANELQSMPLGQHQKSRINLALCSIEFSRGRI